ncbi:hypothetical protein SPBRAN_236 [uncultured Candidatus Thioglobus sp.]|nr:hypothetical protein SPBRAN_236 [uncultured Candidatus Thioglobus sp.]
MPNALQRRQPPKIKQIKNQPPKPQQHLNLLGYSEIVKNGRARQTRNRIDIYGIPAGGKSY